MLIWLDVVVGEVEEFGFGHVEVHSSFSYFGLQFVARFGRNVEFIVPELLETTRAKSSTFHILRGVLFSTL